jgi:hypothetical protein
MNVISMMPEVLMISNSVIGKPALPDFAFASDHRSQSMRISAFDQLDGMLNRYVANGCDEKMDVLGHNDERVEFEPAFTPVSIKSLKEDTDVVLDHEQPSTLPRGKSDEVGSGRRNESSRFQKQTSAAKAAIFTKAIPARVKLVPFPVNFAPIDFRFGTCWCDVVGQEFDQLIRGAIQSKRLIRFQYQNKERLVEPHDYGVQKGNQRLLSWQIGGQSSGQLPGWRWFDVSDMQDVEMLDKTFAGNRAVSASHHRWDKVFIRVEPPV